MQRCFAKYLPPLSQDFVKHSWSLFLSWSILHVLLWEVAWQSEQSGRNWPQGASDWPVSLSRHGLVINYCFRRDQTDVQKVEKEMLSQTEDEIEAAIESVQGSVDTVGPIWSQLQEQKSKNRCTCANGCSVWLVQPDGLTLFTLGTKVTEDIFTKWAFNKLAKPCKKTAFTCNFTSDYRCKVYFFYFVLGSSWRNKQTYKQATKWLMKLTFSKHDMSKKASLSPTSKRSIKTNWKAKILF